MRIGLAPLFQNLEDSERFDAMRRGENVPQADDARVMREHLAIGDLAEPLGFDSLWTFEHRASSYMLLPNPQQMIAYWAGRTSRIDFGSMVTVIPWHHPIRLAENISLLQHMLGPKRRFIMGTGRGLARREYNSLGVDMDESRDRMSEGLEVLRRAFSAEKFQFEGKVYQFTDSVVRPRPLDTSFLDNIYGVWTSDESMKVSAELGLHPLTIPSKSLEAYKVDLVKYDAIRSEFGHGPSKAPILQVFMYCDEDGAMAREKGAFHATEYAASVVPHYEIGGAHFKKLKSYNSYIAGQKSIYGSGEKAPQEEAVETIGKLISDEGVFGTPAECIERLDQINTMMKPEEIVLVCAFGTMSAAEATKSIELFAAKALPAVHRMKANAKVAA
jgi:alkanesulfonate monooxygenase SsuD/methylene tetrahydromethanopterin reductase-like flavin-dependent oxidoreductase (luciferase family)